MLAPAELGRLQKEQYRHDKQNHPDIQNLHKIDRLKHYGLHFAKYVGRLARGKSEPKTVGQTVVDVALVSLSAANTLHQNLEKDPPHQPSLQHNDPLLIFAEAAGRFADGCEKIDHLEEFGSIIRTANSDIIGFVLSMASEHRLNLEDEIRKRRIELAPRLFYAGD